MAHEINRYYRPSSDNESFDEYNGILKVRGDYRKPYSYMEWLKRIKGIRHTRNEFALYKEYLVNWNIDYDNRKKAINKVRLDYIEFMDSVLNYIDENDRVRFVDDINWDSLLEVEQVVPIVAQKLKELTIYAAQKREAVKRSKLKYNMVGAGKAIERLFHEYILKAFTQRDQYIRVNDERLYAMFPELYSINDKLTIKIEEVYDDTEYFDKDPERTPFAYFPIPSGKDAEFYSDLGYSTSGSLEWLFSTGFHNLSCDNPFYYMMDPVLASGGGPVSAYSDANKNELLDYYKFELARKYIGNDVFLTSAIEVGDLHLYKQATTELVYPLTYGNNWFYFPSGEGEFEIPNIYPEPFYLSACTLLTNEGAIGAPNYESADKIFIFHDNTIDGAWLKDVTEQWVDKTMSAMIPSGVDFKFRFPFPGYGLKGEGMDWTGAELENTSSRFWKFSEETRKDILNAYWSASADTEKTIPLSIHDTTLILDGATPGATYSEADHLSIRDVVGDDRVRDGSVDGVYHANYNRAFLFDVTETDTPILPGRNYISWPLQKYDVNDISEIRRVPDDECKKFRLAHLNGDGYDCATLGSRAGYGLFDSDIIYKLNSPNGHPVECAYLKGTPFTNLSALSQSSLNTTWTDNATGCFQSGLNLKVKAADYCTFMWLDKETKMDDVVFSIEHAPDCPYKMLSAHHSLYNENPLEQKEHIDYHEWKKCTCGAIKYSPLGHPGKNLEDFNYCADMCFVDNTYPLPFNKSIWLGNDGFDYTKSADFGWYQLTSGAGLEPDVGWGEGHWVAGGNPGDDPQPFVLKTGYQYKYFRSGINYDEVSIMDDCVPYLVIRHKTSNEILQMVRPVWKKAIANENGNWEATDEQSDMVISPNDCLVYDHADTNWYCITAGDLGVYTKIAPAPLEESDNDFCLYSSGPVGTKFKVQWPSTEATSNVPSREMVSYVIWEVQRTTNTSQVPTSYTMTIPSNTPIEVGFDGTNTGQIIINASALVPIPSAMDNPDFYSRYDSRGSDTEPYPYQVASACILNVRDDYEQTFTSGSIWSNTISMDSIGFPMNVPLSPAEGNKRVLPFWAKGSDDSDYTTRNKGTSMWGGGSYLVDDYIPIYQPDFSDIVLSAYTPVIYNAKNNLTWKQPVKISEPKRTRQWCKLVLRDDQDPALISQIRPDSTAFTYKDIVVSATDETSDIEFRVKYNGQNPFINYWANNEFTWTQPVFLTDPYESNYMPGYSDTNNERIIESYFPYANLTNRHYPTVASVPVISNFYVKGQVGQYFTPMYLGAPVALSKNLVVRYDYVEFEGPLGEGWQQVSPFNNLDGDVYTCDYGFSKTKQNEHMVLIYSDASWMKASITEGRAAGNIVDAVRYEQFMPYRTNYEDTGVNQLGLHRQNDPDDPWDGENDYDWRRSEDYPKHFTKQEPVRNWMKHHKVYDDIYEFHTDVYGYSYALSKPLIASSDISYSIYDKNDLPGDVIIRLKNGQLVNLTDVITVIRPYVIKNGEGIVQNFYIYGDIIVMRCSNDNVVIYKLEYDNSNETESFNRVHLVDKQTNILVLSGGKFAGVKKPISGNEIFVARLFISDDNDVSLRMDRVDTRNLITKTNVYTGFDSLREALSDKSDIVYLTPASSYNEATGVFNIVLQVVYNGCGVGIIYNFKVNMLHHFCDGRIIKPTTADKLIKRLKPYKIVFDGNAHTRNGVPITPIGEMEPKYYYTDHSGALPKCEYVAAGFDFIGWSLAPGETMPRYKDCDVITRSGEDTEENQTIVLYAQWTPKRQRVVFDRGRIDYAADVRIGGSMDSIIVECAPAYTIAPDCGFTSKVATFNGWKLQDSDVVVSAGEKFYVPYINGDYILTAQWDPEYWTLIMHSNNALNITKRYYINEETKSISVVDQAGMGLPNFEGIGWSYEPNGIAQSELIVARPTDGGVPLSGDMATKHVYAQWQRETYTIDMYASGGKIVDPFDE